MKSFQIRSDRVAEAVNDLASFTDGLAIAFGIADRVTPAVVAGVTATALRTAARFLPGDSGHPQA